MGSLASVHVRTMGEAGQIFCHFGAYVLILRSLWGSLFIINTIINLSSLRY